MINKMIEFFNDLQESVNEADGNRTLNWIAVIIFALVISFFVVFIVYLIIDVLSFTFIFVLLFALIVLWAVIRIQNMF